MQRDFHDRGYRYVHSWTMKGNPSDDYLGQCIATARQMANEWGCDQVEFWAFDDAGSKGVRFGSNDFVQKARMEFAMFGDGINPGNHVHTHMLSEDESFQERWVETARSFLNERNIRFDYSRIENRHEFRFDRASHAALFHLAIIQNDINPQNPLRPGTGPSLKLLVRGKDY
jgi:hypothetical protein